jgi:Integrase zinc binding domain
VRGHVGILCLYKTIANNFYAPLLQDNIEEFVKACDTCQCFKLPGIARGELPPKNLTTQPWDDVSVDLIVPGQSRSMALSCNFLP